MEEIHINRRILLAMIHAFLERRAFRVDPCVANALMSRSGLELQITGNIFSPHELGSVGSEDSAKNNPDPSWLQYLRWGAVRLRSTLDCHVKLTRRFSPRTLFSDLAASSRYCARLALSERSLPYQGSGSRTCDRIRIPPRPT